MKKAANKANAFMLAKMRVRYIGTGSAIQIDFEANVNI